ncbi:MAG: hypothetical protein GC164_12590 [Phycisphaera sp.]|nr:hypothetical protein [Phycisphaera sp.]
MVGVTDGEGQFERMRTGPPKDRGDLVPQADASQAWGQFVLVSGQFVDDTPRHAACQDYEAVRVGGELDPAGVGGVHRTLGIG